MNHHIRSKSDTDFFIDKNRLDNIHLNLKVLKETSSFSYKQGKSENLDDPGTEFPKVKKKLRRCVRQGKIMENMSLESLEEAFFFFLIKLFNFKKEFDQDIFSFVSQKKYYVDTLLQIIEVDIEQLKLLQLKVQFEDESDLISRLNKFIQIIKELESIKPEEYYRELKTMLLNEFEQTQFEIKDYLESIQQTDKSKLIIAICHSILFIQSKISYVLDCYSLTMNSLLESLFVFFIAFIDANSKESSNKISPLNRSNRLKSLQYIDDFISLSKIFTQDFYSNESKSNFNETKNVSMNNFSSFGRYILNNYSRISSQIQAISTDEIIDKKNLFTKIHKNSIYWKSYLVKNNNKDGMNNLDQSFRLYFNLKLVVWKSSYLSIKKSKKSIEICRICEKTVPISDFILHINYCKEQKMFYDKMRNQKEVLKTLVNNLEEYCKKNQINEEKNKNNLFSPTQTTLKVIKRLIGFEHGEHHSSTIYNLLSKWNSDNEMMAAFIKAYAEERDLPLNYYEENPNKCPHIVSLIYFTHLIYQINYFYSTELTDFNTIFSELFACFIERLMNTQYLLSVQETRMKSCKVERNLSKKSSRIEEDFIYQAKGVNDSSSSISNGSVKRNFNFSPARKNLQENDPLFIRANSVSFMNDQLFSSMDFSSRIKMYKSKVFTASPRGYDKDRRFSNFTTSINRGLRKHLTMNPIMSKPHCYLPFELLKKSELNTPKKLMPNSSLLEELSIQNSNSSESQEKLIFERDGDQSPPNLKKNLHHLDFGDRIEEKPLFTLQIKTSHLEPEASLVLDSPSKTTKKSLFGNKKCSLKNGLLFENNSNFNKEESFNIIKIDQSDDKSSNISSESDSDREFDTIGIEKTKEIIEIFEELFGKEDVHYNSSKSISMSNNTNDAFSLLNFRRYSNKSLDEVSKESETDTEINNQTPKISQYQFILKAAEGGYGRVDIYKKISTGDLYAIKTVNINKMKTKNLSATLKNETKILNNMNHRLVVKCYYIFKDNVNFYYVMEYMPGGDLYQLLSSIVLPQNTIKFIIAEVLLALLYLHSQNIIHKDIKPENILISKDGHFKVTDFGLSESDMRTNSYAILHKDDGFELLGEECGTREIVGTLNYMAPEAFEENSVSFSVDYWALGVLIYELYTFKAPFTADTQSETRENILKVKINWSHLEAPDVKESYSNVNEAKDLISKFLVKNTKERWNGKDFHSIKTHPFFEGFYWEEIEEINDKAVLMHLKKQIVKTNKQIKESKDNTPEAKNIIQILNCGSNSLYNGEFYCERVDNLFSKCQDLIKIKFRQKELSMNDDNDYSTIFDDMI